jgi:hypothetical protein
MMLRLPLITGSDILNTTPLSSAPVGIGACVDGPSDAREKARILTGGSIAIMCPAFVDAAR